MEDFFAAGLLAIDAPVCKTWSHATVSPLIRDAEGVVCLCLVWSDRRSCRVFAQIAFIAKVTFIWGPSLPLAVQI